MNSGAVGARVSVSVLLEVGHHDSGITPGLLPGRIVIVCVGLVVRVPSYDAGNLEGVTLLQSYEPGWVVVWTTDHEVEVLGDRSVFVEEGDPWGMAVAFS